MAEETPVQGVIVNMNVERGFFFIRIRNRPKDLFAHIGEFHKVIRTANGFDFQKFEKNDPARTDALSRIQQGNHVVCIIGKGRKGPLAKRWGVCPN